jgi:bacterioferritin (cytochrome b1)
LLENNLVHKEDYNGAITDLKEVIKEQQNGLIQTTEKAEEIIKDFEIKNDKLRKQLDSIQIYITNNYGMNTWNEIRKYWEK